MAVLSDEEKKELKQLACSKKLRDEFRLLKENSNALQSRISVDDFISFLNTMSRLCPNAKRERDVVIYKNVRL